MVGIGVGIERPFPNSEEGDDLFQDFKKKKFSSV